MPTYGYDCTRCGAFVLVRPMVQAAEPAACPQCGAAGRQRWAAPALRSVDAPGVVTGPPPRRGARYTTDPRHLRLPEP